ncbi:MOSC domain-containing protein [Blastococcus haudaquaticus]|uniref:MOSC domain-containing protein YiiM n=1 Tax=Blastococcus haudaquaticus TaxID=1938745 RepID=A0A286H405_9ACTN|nr:MOSC domain-containing protein [Blastococcus haudaquaticus]SOE02196.1 MOSC domain-containing protein YiiM [Blastococcus haudaquaticus]
MNGRIDAVCVSGPRPIRLPRAGDTQSAIDKRPVDGRVAVQPLGLDGDVQVNRKWHGGEGQAVYAYAQEDADWWAAELDRDLPAGRFGENLRTSGLDLTHAVLGERWRIGDVLVEVTAPRTPCAKLQAHWGVPRLIKRFTERGASGAYLRVLETGDLGAGDVIEVVERPDHDVTIGMAFRAFTTEQHRLADLAPARAALPLRNRPKVDAAVAERAGTPA